ncbi:MAG: hypothetical protein IJ848_02570 [Alphaproteobacteria bacterium]|nr:hypothetical protein [Alphaproteobacteria bacterium]
MRYIQHYYLTLNLNVRDTNIRNNNWNDVGKFKYFVDYYSYLILQNNINEEKARADA